uniref:Secreted protein n=1 Tax=Ascaris lumbricoides TaxID=6252 RepID=A0A0M3I0W1_ASCLU
MSVRMVYSCTNLGLRACVCCIRKSTVLAYAKNARQDAARRTDTELTELRQVTNSVTNMEPLPM